MAKDHDDGGFSLEEILAEFGGGSTPAAPPEDEPVPAPPEQPGIDETEGRDWREDTIPFPVRPKQSGAARKTGEKGAVTPFPGGEKPPAGKPSIKQEPAVPRQAPPEPEAGPEPEPREDRVLEFPAPGPENPVAAGIGELRRKADDFAEHMYEDAGAEKDKAVRRAERLIPGVDEEEAPPAAVRERKPRKERPAPPDLAPAELARRYGKGLKSLRLRAAMVFLLLIPLVYLTVSDGLPLDLPPGLPLTQEALRCYAMAAVQALAVLLGIDVFLQGLIRPFQGRMSMDAMVMLANIFVLADALSIPSLPGAEGARRPFCAAAVLGLGCVMSGTLHKRRGQRTACRAAASASEPYLVTMDEGKWNGKDTYVKWSGPVNGFGSQIQDEDGAERIYRVAAPLMTLACFLFAVISSAGRDRGEDVLWCLAAIFTAAAPLSATLCFGIPWRKLSRRLSKAGAALAGWRGVVNTTGSCNLLLTDIDLFPQGSVTLNGVKIFGSFPIDKVVSVTATVIRDSGSGLEKVFYDLLRSQGGLYRRGEEFTAYEGGGCSEVIRHETVLVGSASFMVLMDVALPPGLKVKNAVFCAIDGELAGIFALNYHLPETVSPAVSSLIRNKITPVLATRDFNLIPSVLRQRFKLPAEKMEFPAVERRRELSAKEQDHSDTLTAVLCREGINPYAEAVVGSRRLRAAVRLSAALSCVGSAVGALLGFYLTFVAGYDSLTPMTLMFFLLMWLVPTPLISGWVDRY